MKKILILSFATVCSLQADNWYNIEDNDPDCTKTCDSHGDRVMIERKIPIKTKTFFPMHLSVPQPVVRQKKGQTTEERSTIQCLCKQ